MAKISGIYVEIKGDATQLKKELREAKDLVTQQAQGMSNALNNALSPAQLKQSINGLTRDLSTLANASKLTGKEFSAIGVDLGHLRRLTGLSETEFSKLQSRMVQTSAANAQEQALRRIASAAGLSSTEVRRLGQQMGMSAASIASVAGASHQAASGLNALSVAGGMIVARVAAELVMLPKAVLDAGIALDSLQRSFVAIAGSEYGAADFIEYLRGESDRLGQSFYDLAPAFKSISAAARGTALEGEPVRKVFSAISEASTALGMSTADTEGALRALGQMISKGNVQAEELRGQLGERLPGAFSLAARAMGVTTAQLNKMLKDGEVLATDLLPKLADEIHKAYGAAAETAALESGQAAVNRLSGAWSDFKANLYYSEPAVAGINAITAALKEMTDEANSLSRIRKDMFWIGETMSSPRFLSADREERLKMLNLAGESTYRGKVNRADVRTASAPIAPDLPAVSSVAGSSSAAREAEQKARAYQKMLVDGRKAAEAIDAWGNAYDERRIKAIADSVASREQALTKDLQLQTEFADKFKAVVLGETEFKLSQIDAQAAAYIKAGSDEVAVAQWVSAEKLKFSRDWQDGATRAMQAYLDSATDYARNVEEVMGMAFQGMEDAVVQFVKTGKLEFADLVTSINAEIARLAFRGMAAESYDWLGGLLKAGMSMAGSYFTGGASVAAGSASSGFNYAGELSRFMSVNAKGNVFESAGLHAYANSIVSQPTIFAFARGAGLMGEAGPEAIMPLRRGPDGVLGVRSASGGDDETKALLRELIAVGRAQKAQKNVFAFDKRTVANELSGPEGEQVTLSHVRRNASAIRRILGM